MVRSKTRLSHERARRELGFPLRGYENPISDTSHRIVLVVRPSETSSPTLELEELEVRHPIVEIFD